MDKCFLKGFGECSNKISGEHYVSESVLLAIAPDGFIAVAGHSWQTPNSFQGIGVKGLQSNILCTHHNSKLSDLDQEAKKFVERLISSNRPGEALDNLTEEEDFDGEKIERWLLKTLFSLSASKGLNCAPLTKRHKEILLGADWPDGWGMYAVAGSDTTVVSLDLRIDAYPDPVSNELVAARFLIAGANLWLLLRSPEDQHPFGVLHPRAFIYKDGSLVRTANLLWQNGVRNLALVFTKIGTTNELPPHLKLIQKTVKPRRGA